MITQEEILDLLAEHEHAIGVLYKEFADLFPDWKNFWMRCSQEEFHHAELIRSMQVQVATHEVEFTGRFKAPVIETSLAFIEEDKHRAQEERISLKNALSTALSLEKSLIESRYYESFATNDPAILAKLRLLREQTLNHKGMVEKALEKFL